MYRRPWGAAAALRLEYVVPAVLAAALTAWRYDAKPLWRDEAFTLSSATRPIDALARLLSHQDAALAAYYSTMHVWLSISASLFWLRLPSAVGTVVAVVLTARLGQKLAGPVAAFAAGCFAAVTPVLVEHAQEARPYPLLMSASAGMGLAMLRYLEQPTRSSAIAWTLLAAVTILVHPLAGLPVVASVLLCAFLVFPQHRASIAACGILPGTLALPIIGIGLAQGSQLQYQGVTHLNDLIRMRHTFGGNAPAVVLVGVLVITGLAYLWQSRRPFWLLLTWVLLPPLGLWAVSLAHPYYQPRYLAGVLPAVAALSGTGVAAAVERVRRPKLQIGSALALIALVVAAQAPSAVRVRQAATYGDDPASAGRLLAAQALPRDAIVFVGSECRVLFAPYLPHQRWPADALLQTPPIPSGTLSGRDIPVQQQATVLARYARVWIATADTPDGADTMHAAEVGRHLMSSQAFGRAGLQLWVR